MWFKAYFSVAYGECFVFRRAPLACWFGGAHLFSAYFSVNAAVWFRSGSAQAESDWQSVAETLATHIGGHSRQGLGASEHVQGGVIEELVA